MRRDGDGGRRGVGWVERGGGVFRGDSVATIGPIGSSQDFDQRRLARSILAEQRVYLAFAARNRDVEQRLDAAERLRDVLHFEDRSAGHGLLAPSPLAGIGRAEYLLPQREPKAAQIRRRFQWRAGRNRSCIPARSASLFAHVLQLDHLRLRQEDRREDIVAPLRIEKGGDVRGVGVLRLLPPATGLE